MSALHRLSAAGTCQRCGWHTGRDVEQDCAPRVIYQPARNSIIDYVAPNGLTFYGQKTLEEVQSEKGAECVILPIDEAHARYEAGFRSPVKEISAERFDEMLNVLPPCKWGGLGESFESFHVSERLAGNIVSWFMRIGSRDAARFLTLDDNATLDRVELHKRARAFIEANPKA